MRLIGDSKRPMTPRTLWVLTLCLALLCETSNARSAQSTSPSSQRSAIKKQTPIGPKREVARNPASFDRINSRADFDLLARVYYQGRLHALPHVMFVIDRRANGR